MFDNRVLRGIFGPKTDEVTGKLRRIHSEELHGLYSSLNTRGDQVKKNEMGGASSMCRVEEGCIQISCGES